MVVSGQMILLVMILTFMLLPVWTAYRHHIGVIKMFTWIDVIWLFIYFGVGVFVIVHVRPLLLAGVS